MLIPLLAALLAEGLDARARRGRLAELNNRLGLAVRREITPGWRGRVEYAASKHPDFWQVLDEQKLLVILSMAGLRHPEPHPADGMIPWLLELSYQLYRPRSSQAEAVAVAERIEMDDCGFRWMMDPPEIRTVRDWYLGAAPDLGRFSFGQAVHAAQDWHHELALSLGDVGGESVPPGTVVFSYPDGWTIQRIDDLDLVHAEGQSMQNCLADGYYDDDIHSGMLQIYSLRGPPDARGWSRPAVTMALNRDLEDWEVLVEYVPDFARDHPEFAEYLDAHPPQGEQDGWWAQGDVESDYLGYLAREDGYFKDAFLRWVEAQGHAVPDTYFPEIKGRQNNPPAPRYRERLLAWLRLFFAGLDPENRGIAFSKSLGEMVWLFGPADPEWDFVWTNGSPHVWPVGMGVQPPFRSETYARFHTRTHDELTAQLGSEEVYQAAVRTVLSAKMIGDRERPDPTTWIAFVKKIAYRPEPAIRDALLALPRHSPQKLADTWRASKGGDEGRRNQDRTLLLAMLADQQSRDRNLLEYLQATQHLQHDPRIWAVISRPADIPNPRGEALRAVRMVDYLLAQFSQVGRTARTRFDGSVHHTAVDWQQFVRNHADVVAEVRAVASGYHALSSLLLRMGLFPPDDVEDLVVGLQEGTDLSDGVHSLLSYSLSSSRPESVRSVAQALGAHVPYTTARRLFLAYVTSYSDGPLQGVMSWFGFARGTRGLTHFTGLLSAIIELGDPEVALWFKIENPLEPCKGLREVAATSSLVAYQWARLVDQVPHEVTRAGASQDLTHAFAYAQRIDRAPTPVTAAGVANSENWTAEYAEQVQRVGLVRVPMGPEQWSQPLSLARQLEALFGKPLPPDDGPGWKALLTMLRDFRQGVVQVQAMLEANDLPISHGVVWLQTDWTLGDPGVDVDLVLNDDRYAPLPLLFWQAGLTFAAAHFWEKLHLDRRWHWSVDGAVQVPARHPLHFNKVANDYWFTPSQVLETVRKQRALWPAFDLSTTPLPAGAGQVTWGVLKPFWKQRQAHPGELKGDSGSRVAQLLDVLANLLVHRSVVSLAEIVRDVASHNRGRPGKDEVATLFTHLRQLNVERPISNTMWPTGTIAPVLDRAEADIAELPEEAW